jgi:hypothetical protein
MIPTFAAATIVGAAMIWAGIATTGWLRILALVFGTLVALISVFSVIAANWGKYIGFNWHFTP